MCAQKCNTCRYDYVDGCSATVYITPKEKFVEGNFESRNRRRTQTHQQLLMVTTFND